MQFQKKNRKPASDITAKMGENEQIKAKEGAIPLSIKATLNSAKKAPSISAKMGGSVGNVSAKDAEALGHVSAKDPGHSDAYLERLKKRLNK